MSLTDKFVLKFGISLYHCAASWLMPKIKSDRSVVISHYKKYSEGQIPDLDNPTLFSEKLAWYKLHDKRKLMELVANKYTVREYITQCGYSNLLNDVLGVFTSVSDIEFDNLPDKFVLKGTHGSGFNIIVRDKSKLNKIQTKLMLWTWLHQNIAWSGREWVYMDMPRHIIAEKYLDDGDGDLRDYKFYCFNGEPRLMQLEIGRDTAGNIRNFYDMDWNLMPFGKAMPHRPDVVVPKPNKFEEMKKIAKDLCKPFQYVRVDFYLVGDKIFFGELTFFPAGGAPDFVPSEYDKVVGDMWKLEK